MNMPITSAAFLDGEPIPRVHTCDGQNTSPPLKWNNVPRGAQSLVLICEDPDAPSGAFVHWVLYNLPATVSELPAGLPAADELPNGARQGRNDFQRIGYSGPCPPSGGPHRYFFRLYALDTEMRLAAGMTWKQLARCMEGHILAAGQLMGTYKRQQAASSSMSAKAERSRDW
jgi:Raf kinase inhibitor-like YbhB/YbcL family protein